MTRRKKTRREKYTIPHYARMTVPRRGQGQMVERAYGINAYDGIFLRRTTDHAEMTTVYAIAHLDDDELAMSLAELIGLELDWEEVEVDND